ncbi:MAG: DUF6751 family protein [Lachnospiraceae bacterium]
MITNSDITIYNAWWNAVTKKKEYKRTIIRNVWWFANRRVSASDAGVENMNNAKDDFIVRIPGITGYVPPEQFYTLSDPEGKWTADTDNIVLRGEGPEIESIGDIPNKRDMFKVLSVSVNQTGLNPHIRIGGGK